MSNINLKVENLHVAYGQSEALHGISFEETPSSPPVPHLPHDVCAEGNP